MRCVALMLFVAVAACGPPRAPGLAEGSAGNTGTGGGNQGASSGHAGSSTGGASVGGAGAPSAGSAGQGTSLGGGGSAGEQGGAGGGGGEGPIWGECGLLPYGPCGDGVLHCGEACDTDLFFVASCTGHGFDGGTLACNDDCTVDTSGCAGTEDCTDGRDNDGDGEVDCVDPDCAGGCADSCAATVALEDPDATAGSTVSLPDTRDPSCVNTGSGPELVYELVAAHTGLLDISLETTTCLVVSVRTSCPTVATELDCAVGSIPGVASEPTLSVPVSAGQTLFVVVEGCDPTFAGEFTLGVGSSAL